MSISLGLIVLILVVIGAVIMFLWDNPQSKSCSNWFLLAIAIMLCLSGSFK